MKFVISQILIVLGLLACFSGYLYYTGYTEYSLKKMEEANFWPRKTFAPAEYDIVLCGDSRVYRGLSPAAMKEVLGDFNILNFGYSSGIFDSFYLENARAKLKKDGKKVYILGLSSHSLSDKTNGALIAELKKSYSPLSLYADSFIQTLFPAISARDFFKLVRGKLSYDNSSYHQVYHLDGWAESDRIGAENEGLASYQKTFQTTFYSEKTMNDLLSFVLQESKNGAKFVALRMPVSVEMKKLEDDKSKVDFDVIKNRLQELGVKWIDVDESKLRSYDGSHLDGSSAVNVSKQLSMHILRSIK